jgi:hypothetical protein
MTAQHRHTAGTPAGGEFASKPHGEAAVTLDAGPYSEYAEALAERLLVAGEDGPWRLRGRDLTGPRGLYKEDVVPEGFTFSDAVAGTEAHRRMTAAIEELAEAAEAEMAADEDGDHPE